MMVLLNYTHVVWVRDYGVYGKNVPFLYCCPSVILFNTYLAHPVSASVLRGVKSTFDPC